VSKSYSWWINELNKLEKISEDYSKSFIVREKARMTKEILCDFVIWAFRKYRPQVIGKIKQGKGK
jgi:hypothetical protein